MAVGGTWGIGDRDLEFLLWAAALRAQRAKRPAGIGASGLQGAAGAAGTDATPSAPMPSGSEPPEPVIGAASRTRPNAGNLDFAATLASLLALEGWTGGAALAETALAFGIAATGGRGSPATVGWGALPGASGLWGALAALGAAGADAASAVASAGGTPSGDDASPWPRDRLETLADVAARRHGLDPALLRAVIEVESGWNPLARSPAGALGLMQLMPATARALGVTDPWDPWQNLEAGARYLRQQLERFGDIRLALAAYNAGPGAVQRHGDVPPYRETQAYVERVLALWRRGGADAGLRG